MVEPQRDISPSVRVSDISLTYPAHGGAKAHSAIEGLNFAVPRSGVLGVLGESGSGKTTLMKFLAGLADADSAKGSRIRVTSGEADVLGVPLRKISRRNANKLTGHIGYLAQDGGAHLTPDLSINDVLLEPIVERLSKSDRTEIGSAIIEMLEIVGLPLSLLSAFPSELSKGQRQRVAVVRSLVLEPALVIADEPTLGVDALNRPRITELYRWYAEKTGATMIIVSHDIRLLETLVHEVLVLQQGASVGYGDISDIFRTAEHRYVQQLAQALRSTAYDEISDD